LLELGVDCSHQRPEAWVRLDALMEKFDERRALLWRQSRTRAETLDQLGDRTIQAEGPGRKLAHQSPQLGFAEACGYGLRHGPGSQGATVPMFASPFSKKHCAQVWHQAQNPKTQPEY